MFLREYMARGKPKGKKVKGVSQSQKCWTCSIPSQGKIYVFLQKRKDFFLSYSAPMRVCSSLGISVPLKHWHPRDCHSWPHLAVPKPPPTPWPGSSQTHDFAVYFNENFFILGSYRSTLKIKLSFSKCITLFIREP